MTPCEFDRIISREGTDAMAIERLEQYFGATDIMPFWIADNSFATPDFVVEAMKQRLEHPIFGYTAENADYRSCLIDWVNKRHGWKVEPEWLTYIPGIVKGIGMAINVFVKSDEKVIIQPPVYHPFRLVPLDNRREVVYNPLKEHEDGTYEMDFENLEKVVDNKCRLLILCNPHNPAGIVWPRETLERLANFCAERGILVISDEIHCDMALWGKKHIPFASVSETAAQNSITFQAPSKTFNIAGIVSSYAIVPNAEIREKFYGWLEANELNEPDIFAPIATMAALTERGNEWRERMISYLEDNIRFVEEYCRENLPQIRPVRPDASFLIWLDCRALGLKQNELVDLFVKKAKLALNDGTMFGAEGEGHMRFNVGFPRSVIKEALDRLKNAING
ncbi:MAG: PatB family C-S lyase [Bacteroides sp.]|nr:PatB family C-S lyase [Bacteroides sp.]MCM1379342.1 PatB family C-S lyase [Bacteroides sp.]MCM1445202.1 PatB family C-S lyase [Prevotella sp.]